MTQVFHLWLIGLPSMVLLPFADLTQLVEEKYPLALGLSNGLHDPYRSRTSLELLDEHAVL